ncbi:glycosyltransferase family 2 protein [Roseicyclus elongatus]|nr:glycosyltransferase family 2 protein [Roseibacterium elongatum]
MRDECMFVTEWVAYHRVIGFDDVYVVTNHCSDGTDELCDRLARQGILTHIRNDDHGDSPPQVAALEKVLARAEMDDLRWLLHIDADEFLNIYDGRGLLSDWLPRVDHADAVALIWRLFGDSGRDHWPEGGLQTQILTQAAERARPFTAMQKTMFRPGLFASGNAHMPKKPAHAEVTLANAVGRGLHPGAMYHPTESDHRNAGDGTVNRKRHLPMEGAVINHYAVRTQDLFALKARRGGGMQTRFKSRYTVGARWYRAANVNDIEETLIQRHLPALRLEMQRLRAMDRDIAEIEAAAYARFEQARAQMQAADAAETMPKTGAA